MALVAVENNDKKILLCCFSTVWSMFVWAEREPDGEPQQEPEVSLGKEQMYFGRNPHAVESKAVS